MCLGYAVTAAGLVWVIAVGSVGVAAFVVVILPFLEPPFFLAIATVAQRVANEMSLLICYLLIINIPFIII